MKFDDATVLPAATAAPLVEPPVEPLPDAPPAYAGEPLAEPAVYAQEPPPPPGDAPPQYSASNPFA